MIAKGARLKDRYRLERLLGRGGMASVWLALDEVLERDVAVKLLSDTIASDPEFLTRFHREARVAAALSHPNLIGVYDYSADEERPYLVMEYVPGENLAQRTARRAEVDCERLARELLGALAHIHAAGIVHRDVKPQNVLIAPGGEAKLIDFGIAQPQDATSLTHTGQLIGTARYLAPEVMSGAPATERSDLYSCGIVLRDCLSESSAPRLRALVERLTARDPRERPGSAKAALAELERARPVPDQPTERFEPTQVFEPAARSEPTRRPRPVAPAPAPPPRPRRARGRAGALAAIVATMAALAVALLVLTGGPEQDRGGGRDNPSASAKERDAAASAPEEAEAEAAGPGEAETEPEPEAEPEPEPEAEAVASPPEPAGSDPDQASALNQEGFELLEAGSYEEAIPVLEEAVRAFPPETEELDYAYALFNLGRALRLGGRPEEAIPVLERRLEIPNQTGTVSRELASAREEAGQ
jgi:eukaryotic-like serine/threonine-protein kinase